MTAEARLEEVGSGLAPVSPGWFVVNVGEAAWVRNDAFGARCVFESSGRVLVGECLLLIEDQERRLRAWDFVHCPAGTRHVFVGVGDALCVIFMTGARRKGKTILYPRSEAALARGAGVEAETDRPVEAYAPFSPWRLGRPDRWAQLRWSR